MARSVADALAAVGDQVPLELAQRHHARECPAAAGVEVPCAHGPARRLRAGRAGLGARATIEELPGVITCAPTLDEARELVRDALDEWLAALTSEERAAIGLDATRETLTLGVA
ncbi:MAG TPA: type II toxin-antitoxin system HicB family antitoxin [Gaiellaceae bacterium]|nr:type II toxin-antitoxin system HicB family antitoxin [Gaiellaceae bacterium]